MEETQNNDIKKEADYCLKCKLEPCKNKGCPLHNEIASFIKSYDNIEKAYNIILKEQVIPSICGRICPKLKQCEMPCTRNIAFKNPVKIGKIESYIGDMALKQNLKIEKDYPFLNGKDKEIKEKMKNKKVCVIGSGPAGITCSSFLARNGINVTIFEKNDKLGGLMRYGIPDFRLDRKILDDSIKQILNIGGITYKTNQILGENLKLKDLQKDFDAIFISIGANIGKIIIKNENTISANQFLENLNILKSNKNEENLTDEQKYYKNLIKNIKGKKIGINGGGNVALDVSREINRLGAAETKIIYRRSKNEMPADLEEVKIAEKEGIILELQTNVLDFKENEASLIKTRLEKKEGEKRLSPVNIKGSNYTEEFDYLFYAIGEASDKNLLKSQNLELNNQNYIKVDENYKTNLSKVFAGGDVIGTTKTVAFAANDGKNAAKQIVNFLCK